MPCLGINAWLISEPQYLSSQEQTGELVAYWPIGLELSAPPEAYHVQILDSRPPYITLQGPNLTWTLTNILGPANDGEAEEEAQSVRRWFLRAIYSIM